MQVVFNGALPLVEIFGKIVNQFGTLKAAPYDKSMSTYLTKRFLKLTAWLDCDVEADEVWILESSCSV